MKKVLKTILMGAVAFSLAMGVAAVLKMTVRRKKAHQKLRTAVHRISADSFVTSLTTEK
mgnify:CR=1 FL=1